MAWTLQTTPWDVSGGIGDSLARWSTALSCFIITASAPTGAAQFGVLLSSDGITWTSHLPLGGTYEGTLDWGQLTGMDESAPLMCSGIQRIGTPAHFIQASADGVTFTGKTSPFDTYNSNTHFLGVSGMGYSPDLGLWVAGSNINAGSLPVICTSPDATTWTQRTTPWDSHAFPVNIHSILWIPSLSLFLAIGFGDTGSGSQRCFMTSPDGITWTSRNSFFDNGEVYGACFSAVNSKVVAGGYTSFGGADEYVGESSDGITWANVANDPFKTVGNPDSAQCFTQIEAAGKVYVGGYKNNNAAGTVWSSPDLSTWSDESCPLDNQVQSLAYSPSLGMLVAVGAQNSGSHIVATMSLVPPGKLHYFYNGMWHRLEDAS